MRARHAIGVVSFACLVGLMSVAAGSAMGRHENASGRGCGGLAVDPLEAKMNRRFPQKVRVGDLIGLPVLDDDDVTLGYVQNVVRTPENKIKLIVRHDEPSA